MFKIISFVYLNILVLNLAFTQDKSDKYFSLSIQFDQDVLYYGNEDRNYTQGLGIEVTSSRLNTFIHNGLKRFDQFKSNLYRGKDNRSDLVFNYNNISFFGAGFTPDSLGTVSIVHGDRPYSSIGGLSFGITHNGHQGKKGQLSFVSRFSKVNVGLFGLQAAESLQAWIHTANEFHEDTILYINPVKPYGWDNQISNGGGLTFLYQSGGSYLITKKYLKKFTSKPISKKGWVASESERLGWLARHFELQLGYNYSVGYYNKAQINSGFRFGSINPTNWSVKKSSDGDFNNFVEDFHLLSESNDVHNIKKNEFFLFGHLGGNFMLYNSMLRGQILEFLNFGETRYVLEANEVNPLYLEGKIGIGFNIDWFNAFIVPIAFRTSELNTIDKFKRTHYWGEIRVGINIK